METIEKTLKVTDGFLQMQLDQTEKRFKKWIEYLMVMQSISHCYQYYPKYQDVALKDSEIQSEIIDFLKKSKNREINLIQGQIVGESE